MSKLAMMLEESSYFDQHQRVLVAVSGGLDSMNLLMALHVSRETLGIELGIAHVNHHQRPEADQEEKALRHLAQELDLPIVVGHFEGAFSEGAARDYRYAFFARVMAEQGYTALVTAHHRDDQVETIFHRLLRGSRLRHLTGIQPVQPFAGGQLIRPFLGLSKADLPDLPHFEDSSNHSPAYLRNRIRHNYLPSLRQENPQLDQHLLDLAEEVDVVLRAVRDLTQDLDVTDVISFGQQSPAVQNLLLQDYLTGFSDLAVTKAQFKQLQQILTTKANYRAPFKAGYWLIKDYTSWKLEKINPQTEDKLAVQVLDCEESLSYAGYRWTFSAEGGESESYPLASSSALLLRQPRPGDRLKRGKHHKKLARLFIDDKLPQDQRRAAIVVEQDGIIQLVVTPQRTYLRKDDKRVIMKFSLSIKKENP